jgi:chemotaxis family two-component system response regulator Rcp1
MADMIDILLVDDSEADRDLFQQALNEVDPEVRIHCVCSGDEALAILLEDRGGNARHAPKIVVMDLNMPGLDGIETLRAIRASEQVGALPVVLLSSSSSKRDVNRAYRFGANAFFSKPCGYEPYVEKVRALVGHWLALAELPSTSLLSPY